MLMPIPGAGKLASVENQWFLPIEFNCRVLKTEFGNGSSAGGRTLITILSGGQTGVDRAALDAALETGTRAGGWCPEGRKAEDGQIPEVYPLQELPGADYLQRTEQNVVDCDATLIIYFTNLVGGTARTRDFCELHGKSHLLVDAGETSESDAAGQITDFVRRKHIARLNVAGPRASGEPRAYPYTLTALTLFLSAYGDFINRFELFE